MSSMHYVVQRVAGYYLGYRSRNRMQRTWSLIIIVAAAAIRKHPNKPKRTKSLLVDVTIAGVFLSYPNIVAEIRQNASSNPTLLRKLLAPQLHRESSIALQAVRFIVESNFFLDDPASSSPAKEHGDLSVDTPCTPAVAVSVDTSSDNKNEGKGTVPAEM